MTPAQVKTTMAALASIATPAHLRSASGATVPASPAPIAAAPQGAAPRAATGETVDWDAIVADMNATLTLHPATQTKGNAR